MFPPIPRNQKISLFFWMTHVIGWVRQLRANNRQLARLTPDPDSDPALINYLRNRQMQLESLIYKRRPLSIMDIAPPAEASAMNALLANAMFSMVGPSQDSFDGVEPEVDTTPEPARECQITPGTAAASFLDRMEQQRILSMAQDVERSESVRKAGYEANGLEYNPVVS